MGSSGDELELWTWHAPNFGSYAYLKYPVNLLIH